jgi:Protein of unknown function (DUF3237)
MLRFLLARTRERHGRSGGVAMELVPEFSYTAKLKPPVAIGGPFGQRMFFEVTEGEVTGERVRGRVLTGGGDWAIVGADGMVRLDVRAQIETHDGANVLICYHGMLEFNEAVQNALGTGAGTEWGDQYFRTTPRFETGDERYAWLTRTVFVAEGRVLPGSGVEYRVSRVA